MSKAFRIPAFEIHLTEADSVSGAPPKIQLFRTGTFFHPEYGKFEITPAMLAEMKKNFDARVRGIDLAVDYKHDNQDVASGWIKSLELADDGKSLYASVDWTPKGKQVILDREFRYISPEFSFNYKDNEDLKDHGPTLLGAALTNRPVIKKMDPVVELSEVVTDAGQQPLPPTIKTDVLKKSKGDNKMGMKKLADMSPEDLKAMSPEEMMALLKELQGKLDAYEQEAVVAAEAKMCAEKKASFTKLLSEGKACAAQEDAFMKGDMTKFIELAQPVKLSESGNGGTQGGADDSALSIDDKIHKLAEEKIKDKTAKDLSTAYSMVLKENKELAAQKYPGIKV